MTIPDFLERYSISRSAFYRAAAQGGIRVTKIGKATRIALADAEAWAASLPTHGGEALIHD
jgi:hypothetical protein